MLLPDNATEAAPKHRALSASAVILWYMSASAIVHGCSPASAHSAGALGLAVHLPWWLIGRRGEQESHLLPLWPGLDPCTTTVLYSPHLLLSGLCSTKQLLPCT